MAALKSAPELFQKLSEQFLFVTLSSVALVVQFYTEETEEDLKEVSFVAVCSQIPVLRFVETFFNENAKTKVQSCWEDIVFET